MFLFFFSRVSQDWGLLKWSAPVWRSTSRFTCVHLFCCFCVLLAQIRILMQSVLSRRFADSWQLISYTHVNLFLSFLCFLYASLTQNLQICALNFASHISSLSAYTISLSPCFFYGHHPSRFALSLSCASFEGLAAVLKQLNVSISQSLLIPRPTMTA